MSKVDLHIHTTASDGKFTPAEIVRLASEQGLTFISITDHDTVNGILPAWEAARNYREITVVAGVEINTDIPSGELHILGYFCDIDNQELLATLKKLRNSRIIRAQKMVEKLRTLGIKIDFQRVREIAGDGTIGRPHIAEAMLEKGYITTFKEAFNRYIGRDGPAYVERDKITPVEAIQLILRARGIPVMAHPFTFENPETLISECRSAGLLGIEVYYGNYTPNQVNELLQMAGRYGLIPTGGSDFHGLDSSAEPQLGTVEVPIESAEALIALARQEKPER